MSKHQTFAEFFASEMDARGWSNRILAERAGVSFRTPADIYSGKLERLLESGEASTRKLRGAAGSTFRTLTAFGIDPKPWMDKLGLPMPTLDQLQPRNFTTQITAVLQNPVTSDLLERFRKAQEPLGDLFTVEILLKLLIGASRTQLRQKDGTSNYR